MPGPLPLLALLLALWQDPPPPSTVLPDIPSLMHAVETHQRLNERRAGEYTWHERQELDDVDGKGALKKRRIRTYDIFSLQGVRVRKLLSTDGKPSSPEELRKEDEQIDKEVDKARKHREQDGAGADQDTPTGPAGQDVVTVSRILELGRFVNPRRLTLDGRSTIVVDYLGDPAAKARNRAESVFRSLAGTLWVDEQDQQIVRLEGRFVTPFKIGGGLLGNVHEGTTFAARFTHVNNDVWLPAHIEGHGSARFLLLFSFNGSLRIDNADFRRFHATSTLLPGVGRVDQP